MRHGAVLAAAGAVLTLVACGGSSDSKGGGSSGKRGSSAGSAGASSRASGGASGATSGVGGSQAGRSGSAGGASGAGGSGGSGGASGGRSGGGTGGLGTGGGSGGDAGQAGDGASGSPAVPTGCDAPAWDPADFDTVYEVGPGLDVETPSEVPWESLEPGTLVRIHHRVEPYRDKWVVSSPGTADQPIVVLGVPEDGALPVITGEDASTRSALDYWNEERGIVKIGGANEPAGPPAHISVECLDIQTGRPGTSFTAADGSSTEYAENAACVYLEEGAFISVKNNLIHGCGNGIFSSSGTSEVLIAGNYVHDNGNTGSIYEHNSYTESLGITFEFNHYGPLCTGCEGNNLKDRSAGTVIRYNWIEAGNRQLDLVESDYDEFVDDPRYAVTYVYGNVLVEPDDAGNSQILHYGGDGDDEARYRKGDLYFFHNTVVSTRAGNTTLFRLSTEDETVTAFNNVFSVTAGGDTLAVSAGTGAVSLAFNWLPEGWVSSHDTLTGSLDDAMNLEGTAPGFVDAAAQDFMLAAASACIDQGAGLAAGPADPRASFEYVKHQSGRPRPDDGLPDLGAYERD